MCCMTQDLMVYCSSKAYHDDYAEACHTAPLKLGWFLRITVLRFFWKTHTGRTDRS
jgi:hypothetical protein